MRNRMQMGLMVVALGIGCGPPAAWADTLYVNGTTGNDAWDGRCDTWDGATCGPKATIQAGIDGAAAGDEVVLADGTYTGMGNKNLDFGGKAITVRSVSGDPALCVIDCEDEGRGFYFHSGEGPDSTIAGLTITNGYNIDGGAVYCLASGPTLMNCAIRGNRASSGGGISCSRSSPTVTDCTIVGNSGNAVYCYYLSNPALTNCTLAGNAGDAVYCYSSSNPMLAGCTIYGNTAAGVHSSYNCNPGLTNCTLSGNSAGVFCQSDSNATLTNCILWGNQQSQINANASSVVVTYCDVQGGWPGDGNIDSDPQFAFSNDFHVMPGSPCIDAGTNTPVGGLPAYDPEGNARPLDGDGDTITRADMGAYEFDPAAASIALSSPAFEFFGAEGDDALPEQMLRVRNCGTGTLNWAITGQPAWLTVLPSSGASNGEVDEVALGVQAGGLLNGTYQTVLEVSDPAALHSPRRVAVTLYLTGTLYVPTEYPTIQAALDAASDGDIVEVANGTYAGPGNKNLDFGGKAITLRSASNAPALCVVDCEGDGRGFYFHRGEGPESIVTGLTITNGHVDSSSSGGGGVYCGQSSPTLINCAIRGNSVSGDNCSGGGIQCFTSSPTLTNCTICGNSVTGNNCSGGGIQCFTSSPTLTNCTIRGNSTAGAGYGGGGGVFCGGESSPTLINCTILGNSATGGDCDGGGLQCLRGSPTLTNCTIHGNTTSGDGGGISIFDSSPALKNCILWGDAPQEVFVLRYDVGSPVVTYCDVQGGWPGAGNIDADPLFVDLDAGDYRLSAGSPCIDVGNNAAVPADLLFDLDGQPRITDGDGDGIAIVDMGAYERPATILGDLNCDGVVDFGDINPFVDVLMGLERYAAKHPGCDYRFADCNNDGLVDFGDINPFIDLLLGR